MKKFLFIAAAALTMVSCSKDSEVISSIENGKQNAIGFQVTKENMGRATNMQNTHYNFGVFAYKSTDATNNIMENYLVGFMDGVNKKGYKMDASNQTTLGGSEGNYEDLKSLWSYEKLGTGEYTLASNEPGENYYTTSEHFYMSNLTNQYLRFFDYSALTTTFYAYAPYINTTALGGQVTYTNATQVMTYPAGSIVAGYDDETKYEYLFSKADIERANYNKDVRLTFKHLNSKVRIVFYEDIKGYSVKLFNLKNAENVGIIAVPTIQAGTPENPTYSYASDKLAKTAFTTIDFKKYNASLQDFTNGPVKQPTANVYYASTATNSPWDDIQAANINDKALVFDIPTETLSEDRGLAVGSYDTNKWYSGTVYYGIPNGGECGLTFRVSFTLTSTTGETINVYNAGVHVPYGSCDWKPGKQYTYVFKITKNTNGTTDSDKPNTGVDPTPGDKALYPIVFDGLTIEEWGTAVEHEQPIN